MVLITSAIEIARPPAAVRATFMDFAKYSEWTQGFIKSIDPAPKQPLELEKGDSVRVKLEGMTFNPVVLENNASEFKWRGSLPGLVAGDHAFKFEPSSTTPGATTFTHSEEYTGLLTWVAMKFPGMADKVKSPPPQFEAFNEDLKKRLESGE